MFNFSLRVSLFLLVVFLNGCGSDDSEHAIRVPAKYSELGPPGGGVALYSAISVPDANLSRQADNRGRVVPPRMVILTAELDLEVKNYPEALANIRRITRESGGFVARSSTRTTAPADSGHRSGEATLRIPTSEFDTVLARIKRIAEQVENESVSGNDVTEEFYDVSARIANKEKTEQQYREVLSHATKVKEILEVEDALSGIREEIDRLSGRTKYLQDQASLSTVNLRLHEPQAPVKTPRPTFATKIEAGFDQGVEGFTGIAGALVAIGVGAGPYLVLLITALYGFVRIVRIRQEKAVA